MKFSERKKKIEQKQSIFGKKQGFRAKLKRGDPPLKFKVTFRLTSPNPKTSVLKLSNSIGLILASFSLFSLLSGYLLPDFQLALTHSILKPKSISIPVK